jgi:hypothetical protein
MMILSSCLIALSACNPVTERSEDASSIKTTRPVIVDRQMNGTGSVASIEGNKTLPARYVKAFMCEFDENPIAVADRFHKTPGGRAERARDLALLKSFGFPREARDFGLDSVGGKIAAPSGTTVFGLPVQSLEINGMIGDYNALYVTRFADQVSVNQVVSAARLTMDRVSFAKYKTRYYNRRIGSNPHTILKLNGQGSGNAQLTCQVQTTPD